MNSLGELQRQLYEGKITEENYFEKYYYYRKNEEKKWYSNLSIKKRKQLHRFLLAIFRIKNRLGGFSYEIVDNKSCMKLNKPIIFAITHVGKFDIEVLSEAIKEHYFLLTGDFEHIQGTIDAHFLGINGVIYFNEKIKDDRASVSDKMIEILKHGGNLMYFPEGTWNLSPNLPVLPCYWGIINVAKKSNATIVPIAACQYGKHFKINIGNNIEADTFGEGIHGKTIAIDMIRNILASLSWRIYESGGGFKRATIDVDEWEKYKALRFKEWTYFNVDDFVYKPKGITSPQEVISEMKNMQPNINNSFLFDKRNSGIWKNYVERLFDGQTR